MYSISYQILQFSIILLELMLFGVFYHVLRAVFNPFPDKISNKAMVNILVSSGYSWVDHFLGTEYHDVTGYYKLDSYKNLKISVWCMVLGGVLCLAIAPNVTDALFQMNEWLYGALIDRIVEVFGPFFGAEISVDEHN